MSKVVFLNVVLVVAVGVVFVVVLDIICSDDERNR